MKSLLIPETAYTPKIDFNTNGQLKITGKSLPEDTAVFYEPIIDWMAGCQIPQIKFTIRLDYMNSSSAHMISKLLLTAKTNSNLINCDVDWYYETEDEDSYDFGKEMEYLTDFKFTFYQYAEVPA